MSNYNAKPNAAPEIPVVTPPPEFTEHPVVQFMANWLGGIQPGKDDIFFVRREHPIGLCTALLNYLHITLNEEDLAPSMHPQLFAKLLVALILTEHDGGPGAPRIDEHWLTSVMNRSSLIPAILTLQDDILSVTPDYPFELRFDTLDYLKAWQQNGDFQLLHSFAYYPGAFDPS